MQKIPEPLEMPRYLETLHAYVQSTCGRSDRVRDLLANGKWPCPLCDASGKIWDPREKPCPIEGNKMRSTITCNRCGGCGVFPHEYWVDRWEKARDKHMDEMAAHDSKRVLMCRALAKLTVAEAAALGWKKP